MLAITNCVILIDNLIIPKGSEIIVDTKNQIGYFEGFHFDVDASEYEELR